VPVKKDGPDVDVEVVAGAAGLVLLQPTPRQVNTRKMSAAGFIRDDRS
jgi:hypothetical protein